MAAKTIRHAYPAGGWSLRANRPLCWQTDAARRQPSETISGTKSPASKNIWNRSLFPMGAKLREIADELIGITQDPFMLGTIQGHLLQFNHKPPIVKPTCKWEVKVPKTKESMMSSEVTSTLSEGTREAGSGNKGFFMYPFLICPKK